MSIDTTPALRQSELRTEREGGALAEGDGLSRWLPSLSDWVFAAVLGWMFVVGIGSQTLLADGDTGWHIKVGEQILATGRLPATDPFSFTMEGVEWFAWEWLADVALGLAHRLNGLEGVALLAGGVIAATAAALLRFQLWLGANLFVAIFATMLTCSVSTMHWLARPHMFTWGFFLATVWLLEADRRNPTWRVWLLVPMAAIWVNVHGGFVAQLVTIGIFAAGVGAEQYFFARSAQRRIPPSGLLRYGALLGLCLAATLLNPWTFQLHAHIVSYLQSDFILEHVQEFQSPNFRKENMRVFEAALLLGAVACGRAIGRGEIAWPLLVVAWAHAALTSVRHVPLFMLIAAPFLARELTLLMEQGRRRGWSWLDTLDEVAADYGGSRAGRPAKAGWFFGWLPVVALGVVFVVLQVRSERPAERAQFPDVRFPAAACDALGERLEGKRVLTTDQWGDYLIYRLYPRFKVFIDGRSDFYAPQVRDDYLALMGSKWDWESRLDRYEFDALLLPVEWSLAAVVKERSDWRVVYDDGQALLFERHRPVAGVDPPNAARVGNLGARGDPLRAP